jgi:hypothetical protein
VPRYWRTLGAAVAAATLAALALPAGTADAVGLAQSSIPSPVPSGTTPQVLDGAVQDLAQVGNRILASGTFSQVRDVANGGTTFDQPYVFAFDPITGAVDRGFRPTVNGVVNTVAAGPNGTVYLGGRFSSVDGTTVRDLAQVSLADGRLTSFRAPTLNGAVNDVLLSGAGSSSVACSPRSAGWPTGAWPR